MRAADVPEYVQDGVVDCGITGLDLVHEREADVEELLRLGFGSCTLEAAVPEESDAQRSRTSTASRAATVYPRLAGRLLAERGLSVKLIEITGSVEVAPRLGLADAIVDLVSSGSTLRTNGLRSLGALFSSEAVLVGRADGDGARAGARADPAQRRRGAPVPLPDAERARRSALDAICELVPGSRAPSVVPLAEPGMVAVHALVPAGDVWSLLPELEAAGGSSILLLPVERMLA